MSAKDNGTVCGLVFCGVLSVVAVAGLAASGAAPMPAALEKLPLGSVRPEGWLRTQLAAGRREGVSRGDEGRADRPPERCDGCRLRGADVRVCRRRRHRLQCLHELPRRELHGCEPWRTKYPLLLTYLEDGPREPRHIDVVGNAFTNCKEPIIWSMRAGEFRHLIRWSDNTTDGKSF